MGNCGCNHYNNEDKSCDCVCEHEDKSTEKKLASLKKSIIDLGYKIEETEEGEIKISQ